MPAPPLWKGKGEDAEHWVDRPLAYMTVMRQPILLFVHYLDGPALDWWDLLTRRHEGASSLSQAVVREAFVQHFGDPTKSDPAWARAQLFDSTK